MPQITATKLVGPLTVKPPSPLPQDLQQFISGAGDKGIILFSLGTLGDAVLQKHQVEMLVEVFGRLEQRIIWRLKSRSWKKFALKTNKKKILENDKGLRSTMSLVTRLTVFQAVVEKLTLCTSCNVETLANLVQAY